MLSRALQCSSPDSRYGSRTRATFFVRPNSVFCSYLRSIWPTAHIPSPLPLPPRPLLKKEKRPASFTTSPSPAEQSRPTACREPPEASGPDAWAPTAPAPAPASPGMAGQPPPPGGSEDDFLEHFFAFPSTASAAARGHAGAGAARGPPLPPCPQPRRRRRGQAGELPSPKPPRECLLLLCY